MSDTPETDAALYPMNQVDIVWPDFARKLERERDEAREKYTTLLTENMLAVNRLYKERDEAREALDCLLAVIGLTPIAGNKEALQDAVDQGLVVLRKLEESK